MNLTHGIAADRRGTIDVDFPLHPATRSPEAVSRLVGQILEQIQDQAEPVEDADVLQALAIATAVRVALANANRRLGVELAVELLDVATDSIPPTRLDG
jgi:hypothetical protein